MIKFVSFVFVSLFGLSAMASEQDLNLINSMIVSAQVSGINHEGKTYYQMTFVKCWEGRCLLTTPTKANTTHELMMEGEEDITLSQETSDDLLEALRSHDSIAIKKFTVSGGKKAAAASFILCVEPEVFDIEKSQAEQVSCEIR